MPTRLYLIHPLLVLKYIAVMTGDKPGRKRTKKIFRHCTILTVIILGKFLSPLTTIKKLWLPDLTSRCRMMEVKHLQPLIKRIHMPITTLHGLILKKMVTSSLATMEAVMLLTIMVSIGSRQILLQSVNFIQWLLITQSLTMFMAGYRTMV